MDSVSHHILPLVNRAPAESLSLAAHTTLMNVLSVDQSLVFSERQIRKLDFMASWDQDHDRRRHRMLWRHREWALRSFPKAGSIAFFQEE